MLSNFEIFEYEFAQPHKNKLTFAKKTMINNFVPLELLKN